MFKKKKSPEFFLPLIDIANFKKPQKSPRDSPRDLHDHLNQINLPTRAQPHTKPLVDEKPLVVDKPLAVEKPLSPPSKQQDQPRLAQADYFLQKDLKRHLK